MGGVWTSSWCSHFDSGSPSGLLVLVCRSVFQAQCLLTLSPVKLMPVSLVPAVLMPPKGFWLLFVSSLVASSMGQQAIGTVAPPPLHANMRLARWHLLLCSLSPHASPQATQTMPPSPTPTSLCGQTLLRCPQHPPIPFDCSTVWMAPPGRRASPSSDWGPLPMECIPCRCGR